ncbi:hypothetical protein NDU88_011237 [Pleurodeles waltl]|uniref:Uncharacterized protein n=1 Tax=Pleurodeles waltl TaxID=8319 RepID=A0AAV7R2H9_PLEWA|nr:hypothetical protein NDU88_011237 [Pleurodeles waltl]
MGAQVRFTHARIGASKQARVPLERGVKRDLHALKERPLVGTSKMAAPSVDSQHFSDLEKRMLGTPVKMAAPLCNVENEVVVISDDEDEVQGEQIELVDNSGAVFKGSVCGEACSTGAMGRAYVSLDFWHPDSGEGPSGCDTSHASSGHEVQASHQRSGRMVGEQSMPVRVRAPSEHRPEGRVKPGAVYPTSEETAGVNDAQPFTSQGAGAGWASMEEDLLDYEDDMEEPVMSRQRVVMAGDMPGVVQGSHSKAHRRDVSAGNLLRGAVQPSGGLDVISRRQDDAVRFVMQQIEAGLAAVTISGWDAFVSITVVSCIEDVCQEVWLGSQ